jgi:hypothetical protein
MRFAETARPGSAAERWAVLVLKGCGAADDPRTLDDWAQVGAMSYTALRQSCEIVDVQPQAARDFVRVLRAVLRAAIDRAPLDSLFNVSDSRTLRALIERSGVGVRTDRNGVTVDDFFRNQRLVSSENLAFRTLCDMVARHTPKTFR